MVVIDAQAHIRDDLLEVLGKPGFNGSLNQAVLQSKQKFVRTSGHLTEFDSPTDGRPITAWEATVGYGPAVVAKLADKPAVGLIRKGGDLAFSFRTRRESLGVTARQIAAADQRFDVSDVDIVEANRPVPSFSTLTRMAEALALRDHELGAVAGGGGDVKLAYRLRELSRRNSNRILTPAVAIGSYGSGMGNIDSNQTGRLAEHGQRQANFYACEIPPNSHGLC